MSARANELSRARRTRIECLRRAVRAKQVVVSAEPLEVLRARRRGRLAIDARQVAAALMSAEPEFFGPESC